jgi:biotin carboxyl carrier protein
MPGKIFKLLVKIGDKVNSGQDLLVLEAMKMEHTLVAPRPGQVKSCGVKIGDLVELGQVLVVIS